MIGPAGPHLVAGPAGAPRPPSVRQHRQRHDPAGVERSSGIRMPRVVLAAIVGAMLSLAGASYQGVFRNPLVDPYLLGVAAGAGLGATIVFAVGRAATAGLARRSAAARRVRRRARRRRRSRTSSGASFGDRSQRRHARARRGRGDVARHRDPGVHPPAQQRRDPRGLQLDPRPADDGELGRRAARAARTWSSAPRCCCSTAATSTCSASATTRRRRWARRCAACGSTVVVAATMGTAAVVSVSGLIGFVGIIVPHFVRLLAGASYRRVLPLSVVLGAAFLVLADIPGRVLQDPAETPIGVVTAFFGAPFFILVLRTPAGDPVSCARLRRHCHGQLRTSAGSSRRSPTRSRIRRVAVPDRAERRRQVVDPARRRRARARTAAAVAGRRRAAARPRRAGAGRCSSPTCRSAPNLPDDMTGVRVRAARAQPVHRLLRRRDRRTTGAIVRDVLDRLDLAEFADRLPRQPERRRTAAPRDRPRARPGGAVLLLDEPTSALDIGHQQQALELVDRLRREHGLTVVSRDARPHPRRPVRRPARAARPRRRRRRRAAADVLRAETLREFYGADVTVHHAADGTVVSSRGVRRSAPSESDRALRAESAPGRG